MKEYSDHEPGRAERAGLVAGRNAVLEFLSSGTPVEKIYLQQDARGAARKIFAIAKEKKIPVSFADKEKLRALSGGDHHQGVVALCAEKEYLPLSDLFQIAQKRGEAPFFVIADGIEDPHNLGALLRCADAVGVHGVILPKKSAVGMTPTVIKASAGAAAHVAVCRVTNLARTLDELKEKGIWIYACEAGGTPYDTVDFHRPKALVFGSEGFGVSRLLKDKSDYLVSLPMRGAVNSLNVSCAAAVILYQAVKE